MIAYAIIFSAVSPGPITFWLHFYVLTIIKMHTLNPIVFDVKSESIIIGSKLDFEIVVFLRVEQ